MKRQRAYLPLLLLWSATYALASGPVRYTQDSDFKRGLLLSINCDIVHNQLQLSPYGSTIFNHIWIANAEDGAVIKLNTQTGTVLGCYFTGPPTITVSHNTTRREYYDERVVPQQKNIKRKSNLIYRPIKLRWFQPPSRIKTNYKRRKLPKKPELSRMIPVSETYYETITPHPVATAMDLEGNCWVVNREYGTVVKILHEGGVDDNHNGRIDTSQKTTPNRNKDTKSDKKEFSSAADSPSGFLPWWEDERVVLNIHVGEEGSEPSVIAIDAANHVWVGLANENRYVRIDGYTGDILQYINVFGPPYCAVIDGEGILWSAEGTEGITRINTQTGQVTGRLPVEAYCIANDPDNHLWVTSIKGDGVFQANAQGTPIAVYCNEEIQQLHREAIMAREPGREEQIDKYAREKFVRSMKIKDYRQFNYEGGLTEEEQKDLIETMKPQGLRDYEEDQAQANAAIFTQGLTTDVDRNLWVAHSHVNRVTQFDRISGKVLAVLNVGAHPMGIALDPNGNPIVINEDSETLSKIDLKEKSVTKTYRTGKLPAGLSDPTGYTLCNITTRAGLWKVTCDGGKPFTAWHDVSWTGEETENAQLYIRVRPAEADDELEDIPWTPVESGVEAEALADGQFLSIEAKFLSADRFKSPVLKDLAVTPWNDYLRQTFPDSHWSPDAEEGKPLKEGFLSQWLCPDQAGITQYMMCHVRGGQVADNTMPTKIMAFGSWLPDKALATLFEGSSADISTCETDFSFAVPDAPGHYRVRIIASTGPVYAEHFYGRDQKEDKTPRIIGWSEHHITIVSMTNDLYRGQLPHGIETMERANMTWTADYSRVAPFARQQQLPMLVWLTHADHPVSVRLEQSLAENAFLQDYYVLVCLEGNAAQNIMKTYDIKDYPALLFIAPTSQLMHKTKGFISPSNLSSISQKLYDKMNID